MNIYKYDRGEALGMPIICHCQISELGMSVLKSYEVNGDHYWLVV